MNFLPILEIEKGYCSSWAELGRPTVSPARYKFKTLIVGSHGAQRSVTHLKQKRYVNILSEIYGQDRSKRRGKSPSI